MKKKGIIFFRNDDIRDDLDYSLVALTELFIRYDIPLTLAVEPANLNKEVVDFLIMIKKQNPNLFEIIQHGYDHNKANKYKNQEFGGNRKFEDQYEDIKLGKELMDKWFGKLWTKSFTFPYGKFNKYTLEALNKLEYIGISSSIKFDLKNRIKNYIGRSLRKANLFGKNVSYHLSNRNKYKFREVSTSVNIIKQIRGYNDAFHFAADEIIKQIQINSRYTNVIGILLHHRFHSSEMDVIETIINYCLSKEYKINSIKGIIDVQIQ